MRLDRKIETELERASREKEQVTEILAMKCGHLSGWQKQRYA